MPEPKACPRCGTIVNADYLVAGRVCWNCYCEMTEDDDAVRQYIAEGKNAEDFIEWFEASFEGGRK